MIEVEEPQSLSETQQLNLVVNRMKIAENARKSQEDKWDRDYKYYRAYRKFDTDYWWRSQLFLPYLFAIIESICPWLIEPLIGGENFFSIDNVGDQSRTQNAENMTELMKQQISEKMRYFEVIVMWIKNHLIYGNGIVKIGWWKQEKEFRYRKWNIDPYFGIVLGSEIVEEKRFAYNDPVLDTVQLENFFPDPYGEDIEDCRYTIERKIVDFDYLKALEKSDVDDESKPYINIDQLKGTKFTGTPPHFDKLASVGETVGDAGGDRTRNLVELLEYQEDDRFITVANRKVVIKPVRSNPFFHLQKTYQMLKDYPLDKEFWAMGECEIMAALQDKANDLENLRIDNLFQALNRMYIVLRNKGLKADQFVSRPYGLIWSDDLNTVKPLDQVSIPREAFSEKDLTRQDMERVSGAWEYAQGATPERKETATGIVKLQQAALRRFSLKIMLAQKGPFKNALNQIMQLNQQKLPQGYMIMKDGKPQRLNPWDIQGKLILKITASSDLAGEKEKMAKLFEIAKDDPYFDQYKIRQRLLDVFAIPGADELLLKTEQVMGGARGMSNMGMGGQEIVARMPEMMGIT